MVMTKKQMEEVKEVVQQAITEVVSDLDKRVEAHRIALFGQNNDNGLTTTVKSHGAEISEIKIRNAKMVALYSAMASAGGLAGSILVRFIFK